MGGADCLYLLVALKLGPYSFFVAGMWADFMDWFDWALLWVGLLGSGFFWATLINGFIGMLLIFHMIFVGICLGLNFILGLIAAVFVLCLFFFFWCWVLLV